MKKNNLPLIAGIAIAFYLLTKKKVVEPPPETDEVPYTPPPGVLSYNEKLDALNYYSSQNGKNFGAKLNSMAYAEVETIYTYIFECRLLSKCIPSAVLMQRINLIQNKYQVKI